MKVYIATKLDNWRIHNQVMGDLKARGHEITYDWTTHGPVFGLGLDAVREVALKELQGVKDADIVVVLWPGGRGTHVELGVALGCNKQIFIMSEVSEHHEATEFTCAFYHHPLVTLSKLLDEMYTQIDTFGRQQAPYRLATGDWGYLSAESCRFCFQVGRVYFERTENWEGRLDIQRVRCGACGRMWDTTGAQQE